MTAIQSKLSCIFCLAAILISLSASASSDHLEPLALAAPSPIITCLLHDTTPNTTPILWMIAMPSFAGQLAIIIDEHIEIKETNDPIPHDLEITKRYFILKFAYFKHKPQFKHGTWEYEDINISEDIEHLELIVEDDFVTTINEAWTSVLKETKYSDTHRFGKDGTTYIFHCHRYYGRTWSPDSGLTATLIELGNKLSELVMSEQKDRETIKTQCLELATEIVKSKNK